MGIHGGSIWVNSHLEARRPICQQSVGTRYQRSSFERVWLARSGTTVIARKSVDQIKMWRAFPQDFQTEVRWTDANKGKIFPIFYTKASQQVVHRKGKT